MVAAPSRASFAIASSNGRSHCSYTDRRSLRRQTADYGHPVYSAITLSVDLEKDPMVDISDFDLAAMAESDDFRTMVTVYKGNNANAYELCERQLEFASDVLARLDETP